MRLSAHDACRRTDDARSRPRRRIETLAIPAGDFAARVVGLTQVVVVVTRWAGDADLPTRVRRDHVLGAIRVRDIQVEAQSRRRTPLGFMPAPIPRARSIVELAGAELGGDDVLSLSQQRGDVMRGIEDCFVVARKTGIQHAIGGGRAVDAEVVVREARRVDARTRHGLRDREWLAKHRRGTRFAALAFVVAHQPSSEAGRQPTHGATELAVRSHDAVVRHAFGGRE